MIKFAFCYSRLEEEQQVNEWIALIFSLWHSDMFYYHQTF